MLEEMPSELGYPKLILQTFLLFSKSSETMNSDVLHQQHPSCHFHQANIDPLRSFWH
jgi:hypothetical protein